jgi:hypothetical protein
MTPSNFSVLPQIFSDETIYSWCATTHQMTASVSAEKTGLHLLGIRHAVRQHDLPATLAHLPIFQNASAIERIEMLRRHTIAGFYWPFLNEVARQSVLCAITVGTTQHWRRILCAASRTQPIEYPLKWCPICIEADLHSLGRTYWHVDHQFPTTTICCLHHTSLHQIPGRHKHWQLPPLPDFQVVAYQSLKLLDAPVLARIGATLLEIEDINLSALRTFTLRRLRDIGVIFSANGVSHDRIQRWFAQSPSGVWCQAAGNGLERLKAGEWISTMLWRRHLGNAVRWVVLWGALDWESPEAAAEGFMDACRDKGLDIDGQLTLFGANVQAATRAPPQVWDAFSECDSYAQVMTKLQRSRSDIVRWLEMDPQLRAHWKQRLWSEKKMQCIATLRATLVANPDIKRKSLEEMHRNEVNWLRKHASQELNELLKAVPAHSGEQSELFSKRNH